MDLNEIRNQIDRVDSEILKLFLERIHDKDTPFFSLKLRYEGERLAYAALDGKELILP